jgi:two-component system nitrate/nitrite response regulator NarL
MTTCINCVVILGPNELLREGLAHVLVAAGCSNCSAFGTLEEMEAGIDPQANDPLFLVILGRDLDVMTHSIGYLRSRFPASRIVILSDKYSHTHLHSAIKAGASGYILNSTSCDVFIKSLEVVWLGEPVIPEVALEWLVNGGTEAQAGAQQAVNQSPPACARLLSSRELEVLRCITQAMSNKHIARECNISDATVKVHVKAILRKIAAKNRTEAALWALENGLDTNEHAG